MKYFSRYLPLSDDMRQQSLYVLAGGYTMIPPHTPYPPSIHPADHQFHWRQGRTLPEYQLIYITRGGGAFESRSGGRCRVEAGTLFMLFPGEWHRYSPDPATGWDEYWVAFQGQAAEMLVGEASLSPAEPLLVAPLSERLRDEFIHITEEMRQEAVGYRRIIGARTLLIMATASACSLRGQFEGAGILPAIEQAKTLLSAQLDRDVNVEKMAAWLGVGYSHFRRAFRDSTGLSPAQYHLGLRIRLASELLRTTALPSAAVGRRVGFDSACYFCRIFKNKTGQSPSEYRAMTQEQ